MTVRRYIRDDAALDFAEFRSCVDRLASDSPDWWSITERRLRHGEWLDAFSRDVDARGQRLILSTADPDLVLHHPGFDGIDTDGSPAKLRRARAVLGSDRLLMTSLDTWRQAPWTERRLVDVIRCVRAPTDLPPHVIACEEDPRSGRTTYRSIVVSSFEDEAFSCRRR